MWYIVLTKPRQEARAQENLENQGAEVYLPMLQTERISQGKRTVKIEPLFPGYLFIRLEKDSPIFCKIRSTLGVNKLLSFGGNPLTIDERLIEDLRQRTATGESAPQFKAGQKVELTDGPFRHYQALFKEYKGSERAIILLSLLGQQNELIVELTELQKR